MRRERARRSSKSSLPIMCAHVPRKSRLQPRQHWAMAPRSINLVFHFWLPQNDLQHIFKSYQPKPSTKKDHISSIVSLSSGSGFRVPYVSKNAKVQEFSVRWWWWLLLSLSTVVWYPWLRVYEVQIHGNLSSRGFRRNRTDDLGINSPSLWPIEPRFHVRSCVVAHYTCMLSFFWKRVSFLESYLAKET